MDTIMVAIGPKDADRADAMVSHAISVAGATDASVVLAHVLSESEFEAESEEYHEAIERVGTDIEERDLSPQTLAREKETIASMVDRLEDAGFKVEIRAAVGDRSNEIVKMAEDVAAENLIISGRKRSPTGKAVFGSTSQEILLTAPCPVTYVRAEDD
ncbi:universal stress protein [Halobacteria archaeon AArc-dxtr1]|nr:universal stress protein [Halobacteria archaeon AArc-dxtr1]